MNSRESIEDKARRLLDEGRVTRLPSPVYGVEGDHDAYVVVGIPLDHDGHELMIWNCTCPAEGPCSHALAAKKLHEQETKQGETR